MESIKPIQFTPTTPPASHINNSEQQITHTPQPITKISDVSSPTRKTRNQKVKEENRGAAATHTVTTRSRGKASTEPQEVRPRSIGKRAREQPSSFQTSNQNEKEKSISEDRETAVPSKKRKAVFATETKPTRRVTRSTTKSTVSNELKTLTSSKHKTFTITSPIASTTSSPSSSAKRTQTITNQSLGSEVEMSESSSSRRQKTVASRRNKRDKDVEMEEADIVVTGKDIKDSKDKKGKGKAVDQATDAGKESSSGRKKKKGSSPKNGSPVRSTSTSRPPSPSKSLNKGKTVVDNQQSVITANSEQQGSTEISNDPMRIDSAVKDHEEATGSSIGFIGRHEDEGEDQHNHPEEDENEDEDEDEDGMDHDDMLNSSSSDSNLMSNATVGTSASGSTSIGDPLNTGGSLFSSMRSIHGMVSGTSQRLKTILTNLRSYDDPTMQLVALQDLAELLSVATEDTLAGYFSAEAYVKELINLMRGGSGPIGAGGDDMAGFVEENPEMMLLACRCVSNMVEAMPSSMGPVVYGGVVPVLCSKLLEIAYIDLAEQALSTLEKISTEYPTSIIREGGLSAVLSYIDFFSTHTQRSAVTIAANCCRHIPADCFSQVHQVIPILERTITYSDRKVVEQSCLCFVRMADSFKFNRENLEIIVTDGIIRPIISLLINEKSNQIGPHIFTQLLHFLSTVSRGSPAIAWKLLEMDIVGTMYQILTGSLAPPADAINSQVEFSQIVHRTKDQMFEILGVLIELLPSLPTDGVFDMRLDETSEGSSTVANRIRNVDHKAAEDASTANASTEPTDPRIELLATHPDLVRQLGRILIPTLIEVFSATVNLNVRQRVVTALLKIVYCTPSEILEHVLRNVAFSSFLSGILSQQEHSSLVISALQLAELLMLKLPSQYKFHFRREGVVHEIEALASLKDEILPSLPVGDAALVGMPPENEAMDDDESSEDADADGDGEGDGEGDEEDEEGLEEHVSHEIDNIGDNEIEQEAEVEPEVENEDNQSFVDKDNHESTYNHENIADKGKAKALVTAELITEQEQEQGHNKDAMEVDSRSSTEPTMIETEHQMSLTATSSGVNLIPLEPATVPIRTTLSRRAENQRALERLGTNLLSRSSQSSRPGEKGIGSGETRAWILQRARKLNQTYFLDHANGKASTPTESCGNSSVLEQIKELVGSLKGTPEDPVALETLKRVATYFKVSGSISSFELLNSGLMEGLLSYLTETDLEVNGITSLAPVNDRLVAFMHVFMGGPEPGHLKKTSNESYIHDDAFINNCTPTFSLSDQNTSPSPFFQLLVKRLQECLSRLEPFEVVTAYQSPLEDSRRNPASMLAKQLRLKLSAEDESSIPKQFTNLIVSIHAIATFKALEDYLRPRIIAGTMLGRPGSSLSSSSTNIEGSSSSTAFGDARQLNSARLVNMFAAFAAATGVPSEGVTVAATTEELNRGRPSRAGGRRRRIKKIEETSDAKAANKSSETSNGEGTATESVKEEHTNVPKLDDSGVAPMDEDINEEYDEDLDNGEDIEDEDLFESELSALRKEIAAHASEPTGTPKSERTVDVKIGEDGPIVQSKPASSSSTSSPSGSSTPAPSSSSFTKSLPSYAAALQSNPESWHMQFTIGDIPIATDTTIYGAVHQYESRTGSSARNVWTAVYPIKYKIVQGPAPPVQANSHIVPSAGISDGSKDYAFTRIMPTSVASENAYSKILNLLRVLNALNSRWADILGDDGARAAISPLPSPEFINSKLTAKMNRQLEEPLIVASSCLPDWSYELARGFPFLFPFETRYLFLQSTSFGYSRSMARWQNQQVRNGGQDTHRRDDGQQFLGRLMRQKVRISRSRMMESAVKVLELYGKSQSVLEVEYFEEVGTGLGPTLEFYSTISKEFCKKSIKMWRDDNSPDSEYVSTIHGLFPRPLTDSLAEAENGKKIVNLFKVLGQFVSKAMLDSRIIDIPFNPVFIRKILGDIQKPTIRTVMEIDPSLGRSLNDLQCYIQQKKFIYENKHMNEQDRDLAISLIEVREAKIDDLYLDFTLPGYPDIELKSGGVDIPVTIHNVDEYVQLVLDYTIGHGIEKQVQAFRSGFDLVFPVNDLRPFSSDELVALFGTAVEDWSLATLMDSLKADHGFTVDSRAVRNLMQVMTKFNSEERREFLQFITGSPKLPIGGWKNLNPQFTVVNRPYEPPLTPDDYLPSVMTCVNYLKLPDYSSEEVLREKLFLALREGKNSFHLS